ncbi:MAG TPA: heme-copper oxidase subunit III [Planctomycetes bacterium]|nr:heme-copper oxidase subunit III [Planctomycetota bacterium]
MSEALAVRPGRDARRALGMTPGKFAMWAFLASDGMGFVGLFAAYIATRLHADWWPDPNNPAVLNVDLTALNTFILVCSSVTMVYALQACREDRIRACAGYLGLTILGGVSFLGIQVYEYIHLAESGMVPWEDNFCATFYSLTCYHGLHVLSGVIYLTCILIGTLRGRYNSKNYTPIEIVGLFWHFVDLVWILLFTFIYLLRPLGVESF